MTDLECLQTIEFIVSVNEDPKSDEREQIMHDIYAVVHSHLPHSCQYVHEDWRKRGEELLVAAKQHGFIQ